LQKELNPPACRIAHGPLILFSGWLEGVAADEGAGTAPTRLAPGDIAAALGATKGAVSQWLAAARDAGPEALVSHMDRCGVAPRLTLEQVRLIADFLWHGAEAYGFRGDVWTCGRVSGVIREEFDVAYGKSQVSRLLKRLGWTPQVPITRAFQRDEEAIARWRDESWPALKRQARRERRELFSWMSRGSTCSPGWSRRMPPGANPGARRVADAGPPLGHGRDHAIG
jgi:transposase